MGILNQEPTLPNIIGGIDARLKGLEKSKRFNAPYLTAAPSFPTNGDMWVRSDTGAVYAYINSTEVQLANSSNTFVGQITNTLGALGNGSGSVLTSLYAAATTFNGDVLDTRLIRGATGSDWSTAYWRIGRLVDSTRMGFIQFGDAAGTQNVSLGVNNTTYLTVGTTQTVGTAFTTNNTSPSLTLGAWSTANTWSSVEGYNGHLLMGNLLDRNVYLRTNGATEVRIGGNSQNTLAVTSNAVTVTGTVTVTGAGIAYTGATIGGGTANLMGIRWATPNIVGTVDNTVSAVLGTVSDRRFKTNIEPLTSALLMIHQLNPVTYSPRDVIGFDENKNLIIGDNESSEKIDGFIADEVEQVAPWLVHGGENGGYQSVNYALFTPMLVKAVQELDNRLQALENP